MPLYPVVAVCAAAFIWLSGRALPERVAAHFDAAGAVNGYLPRGPYLIATIVLAVVLPLLLVTVSQVGVGRPGARINLPNRDYWLAPERRDATIQYLRNWMARFAMLLALLVCFVHWLVVRANAMPASPHLSNSAFYGALVVFGTLMVLWIRGLFVRFRLPLTRQRKT